MAPVDPQTILSMLTDEYQVLTYADPYGDGGLCFAPGRTFGTVHLILVSEDIKDALMSIAQFSVADDGSLVEEGSVQVPLSTLANAVKLWGSVLETPRVVS